MTKMEKIEKNADLKITKFFTNKIDFLYLVYKYNTT